MLARDIIRIFAAVSSGKVMAKQKNWLVFLTGYTCYENLESSDSILPQPNVEVVEGRCRHYSSGQGGDKR